MPWYLLLALLCACSTMNVVEGYVDDGRSTVYICEGHNDLGQTNEWCWTGSAEDLSSLVGLECHATGIFERTSVIGCWWHCDNPDTVDFNEGSVNGCNAHNGCWGCE